MQPDVEARLNLKCIQEPEIKLILKNRTNPENSQASMRYIERAWRPEGYTKGQSAYSSALCTFALSESWYAYYSQQQPHRVNGITFENFDSAHTAKIPVA
jgi:hypothetical protein